MKRIRALTQKSFNINLFAGGYATHNTIDSMPMVTIVGRIHKILDLPPPKAPSPTADPFPAQLDVVLSARPAVFSFTFGIPKTAELSRFKAAGIYVIGTATNADEALQLEAAGVDAGSRKGSRRMPIAERSRSHLKNRWCHLCR